MEGFGYQLKVLNTTELLEQLCDYEWKIPIAEKHHARFKDFWYFSPNTIGESYELQSTFILALEHADDIASLRGVLKCGRFELCNKERTPYRAVNYVDVHTGHRRNKIARNLYRTLNTTLHSDEFLVGTDLSELGVLAHLDKIRAQEITLCPTFNDRSELWHWLQNQKVA